MQQRHWWKSAVQPMLSPVQPTAYCPVRLWKESKTASSKVVLLDTIPLPKDCNCSKITQLPVAPVFAEAIERIYQDKPVSPLFV